MRGIERLLLIVVLANQFSSWTEAQDHPFMRTYQLSRAETDPTVDPYRTFLAMGENATVPDWFYRNHTRASGSTPNGMNMIAPDFLYVPTERKILARGFSIREIGDSGDIDVGRAPGNYPNTMHFDRLLDPYTIIGQMAFRIWAGKNGFGAQVAGIQGAAAADARLGMLYLSTATGKAGRSPDQSSAYPNDGLVPHVALYPHGTLHLGYGTDPSQRPRYMGIVDGNLLVTGAVFAQNCYPAPAAVLQAELNRQGL